MDITHIHWTPALRPRCHELHERVVEANEELVQGDHQAVTIRYKRALFGSKR